MRVARRFGAKVLRQVSEANVGSSVVLVFRAGGVGRTTITLALTKDDDCTVASRMVARTPCGCMRPGSLSSGHVNQRLL